MLGHPVFYFSTIRKYVAYFGTLFNDITIKRFDNDGNLVHVIPVPIHYAPIEKELARIETEPNTFPGRPQAVTLPRMSFEIVDFRYDENRHLPATVYIAENNLDDNDKFKKQYVPVPYDVLFRLSIFVKNAEDGAKIVEQIFPFFTPSFTAALELIDSVDKRWDIPIELNSVQYTDQNEGAFDQRRLIVWGLNFTLRGFFFGPVINKPIVKFTTTRFTVDNANNDPFAIVTITPGMTANGTPTSNAAESVAFSLINVLDDYGFIEEYEGGPFEE
jgi:hypothetical protein